ncbi:RICIN domain-containing protein [Limibacter armeniacum]|uniref:RICIN domain-containing protein n=1 Tax=Limibacter armeniacum TaxID=466084 RepID=UPI002FE59CE7
MKRNLLLVFCLTILSMGFATAQEILLEDVTSFYPRMIRLAASGNANGRLIASFDVIGAGHIYQSTDDGNSWSQIAVIPETQYQNTCCSELYEVPQQLGNTAAGTLFWTVSAHNGAAPAARALKIYKSTDHGYTWSLFSTPVTGNTGLWEAEFAIDDNGNLVMYYASEEHKSSGYNQLIAHKVSTDGGQTWGGEVIDIGMPDNIQRPGMPTVSKLPNGDYVMAYEICGSTYNCDAFVRTSSDGLNWGTVTSTGTRVESVSGNHFSHAPTITWIDNGTANGELLMAAQVLRDGNNVNASRNGQVYFVNSTNASGLWAERAAPIFSPSDGTNPCGSYSTQFVSKANGAEIIQMANKECRMYVASGPFNAPIADGVYRLVAKHSGKALDVDACATSDGANVQQWPWAGRDCQRWKFEYLGNREYKITAQVSGKALEVDACATGNGGNVQQWPWNGADCQRWYVEEVGGGYYRLVSKNSGKVLDVSGCNIADGQNVQQWEWLGGDCQQWKIEPVSPNQVTEGTFRISAKHSQKVLDVDACSTTAGANVQQWPWNGADCQKWTVQATADGYYELISVVSGLALDVDACLSVSGQNVQQWTSNGANCQRWGFEEVETGYYRIISKNGKKVLDVSACSTADGANVQLWDWIGGDCQRWLLTSVGAGAREGIQEMDKELTLKVYPNPSPGTFQLDFNSKIEERVTVSVTNILGQEISRKEITFQKGLNSFDIKIPSGSKGMHIISFEADGINHTKKILIEQ